MSKSHDNHQQHVVFDRVNDSVVTHPDTEAWSSLKSTRAWRARVLGKQGDRPLDPTANLRIEPA